MSCKKVLYNASGIQIAQTVSGELCFYSGVNPGVSPAERDDAAMMVEEALEEIRQGRLIPEEEIMKKYGVE